MDKLLERFKALSTPEKIIVVAGIGLLIDGFLPWYKVDLGFASVSFNGWEAPGAAWSILAILIGTVMSGVIILKHFVGTVLPDNVNGITWPKLHLGGGVAALGFVLLKLLTESSFIAFGFYVGIIAAAALAVAGFLMYREESATTA